MSDDAGREAWLANMRAQMVMEIQGVDQAETGGPVAVSTILQPLPAFAAAERRVNIYMTYYIYMTYVYMYTYTHTYIHTFIYIYIYTINIYTQVTWSRFKCYVRIP